jgi:hypothetical protein
MFQSQVHFMDKRQGQLSKLRGEKENTTLGLEDVLAKIKEVMMNWLWY